MQVYKHVCLHYRELGELVLAAVEKGGGIIGYSKLVRVFTWLLLPCYLYTLARVYRQGVYLWNSSCQ